ncbi:hypothetical protein WA026_021318 [Henosepilachna vigintioctopunctata]|uniref:Peptidase A2B Ty3 transposon peptidase domain-containing protein n=1 Tax=Henosepilachna vigintioctopunctata TaxID=420089 RepID=A0AAW1U6V6_9CUCU
MNRITEPPDKGGGEPSSSVITEAFRVLLNEEIMDIPESQNAQLPNDKVVHPVNSHVSPPAKSHSNYPPLKSVKRKYFVDYAAIELKRKHSEIIKPCASSSGNGGCLRIADDTEKLSTNIDFKFLTTIICESLLNIPSVRRAVEVISNRGDYTDVVATLPEDMVGLYFDEEENFVFQDYFLAECNKTATTNENKTMKSEELDIFSKVEHFVLDKYNNGSHNAEERINIFEKECDRLRVDLDVSKISLKKPGRTPLIRLNVKINNKRVTGIYDSGSNATLVNSRIIEEFKENIFQNEQIYQTISGVTCVDNIVKLPLKIHNIEKRIDDHVLKNDNFSYDILLGLDVIKEFNLIQDDKSNILQRNPENDKIECVTNYKQNELISQLDKKQLSPESNSINDSGHEVLNLNINFEESLRGGDVK